MAVHADSWNDLKNGLSRETQRLRFEGWPGRAVDYLLELQADRRSYFQVSAGPDIAHCTLGPVGAELALRILGPSRLLALLQELENRTNDPDSRTILRWIAVLASGSRLLRLWLILPGLTFWLTFVAWLQFACWRATAARSLSKYSEVCLRPSRRRLPLRAKPCLRPVRHPN